MKAIRVHEHGGPEVLRYEDIETPRPGKAEILVKLMAVGVNPIETYLRSGARGDLPRPYTPGTDAAGVIEECGADVKGLSAGDRVYVAGSSSGTYAQYAVCTLSQVHPLPSTVSFDAGASLYVPYATAYRALFIRGMAKEGETVLVHGASGGVGIAALQFARARGTRAFGTAGTEAGLRLIIEQGAAQSFNHRSSGYMEEIIKASANGGVNLILEMLANVNLGRDLQLLGMRGRVVVVGNRGTVEINPRDLMARDAAVYGMSLANLSEDEAALIHSAIAAGLQEKWLSPVIGKKYPLSEAAQAHREIIEERAYGKILLVP